MGKIYLTASRRFVTEEELLERMAAARVIYLGEKHDNPVHHRLQARVLKALLRRGRKPALAFEMLTRDYQKKISALLAEPGADVGQIARIVGWKKLGWPDWSMYEPLVEIAYRAGLPVIAADLPQALTRAISRKGFSALPGKLARELHLGPADPKHREVMIDELFVSHCEMVPRDQLGGLYDAWRARNRAMAQAILGPLTKGTDGTVMITGGGHASRVMGIPLDVEALAPGTTQFSLSFEETSPDQTRPEEYMEQPGEYDALWFTPPHDREDPCVEFRKSLERFRDRGQPKSPHENPHEDPMGLKRI